MCLRQSHFEYSVGSAPSVRSPWSPKTAGLQRWWYCRSLFGVGSCLGVIRLLWPAEQSVSLIYISWDLLIEPDNRYVGRSELYSRRRWLSSISCFQMFLSCWESSSIILAARVEFASHQDRRIHYFRKKLHFCMQIVGDWAFLVQLSESLATD
jgi:hypothetical protein